MKTRRLSPEVLSGRDKLLGDNGQWRNELAFCGSNATNTTSPRCQPRAIASVFAGVWWCGSINTAVFRVSLRGFMSRAELL